MTPSLHDVPPQVLPKPLQALTRYVSLETVLALVARFGGTELKIPRDPKDHDALMLAVGPEAARALCAALGGTNVTLAEAGELFRLMALWDQALPDSAKTLREHVSLKTVLALIWNYGGSVVYIPEKVTESSALAQAVGLDAASELSRSFRCERLSVPSISRLKAAVRNLEIARCRHEEGLSISALARRFELTQRRIYAILNDARPPAGRVPSR